MATCQATDISDEEAIEFAKESLLRQYEADYGPCKELGCFVPSRRGRKDCHQAPGCFLLDSTEIVEVSKSPRNKGKMLQLGLDLAPDLAYTFLFYGEPWQRKFRAALEANGVSQRVINSILEAVAEEYRRTLGNSRSDLAEIRSDPRRYAKGLGIEDPPEYVAKYLGEA